MALSILPLTAERKKFGVWSSDANKFIYQGSEELCENFKHELEDSEQKLDNERWKLNVYEKRMKELTSGGMTFGEAAKHIKDKIKL